MSEKPKETGKKKKTQEYSPEDKPYTACLWLIEQIKAIHPSAKVPEESTQLFQKWCDTLRLMIERDGREWSQFQRIVEFMRDDDFWGAILLSASGVRKHWDKAWAQYERSNKTGGLDTAWGKIMDAAATYGPNRKGEALNVLGDRLFGIVDNIGWYKLCTADNMNQYKGEFARAWKQG